MKVVEVVLRRIRMPLVAPFRSSEATTVERDALLVHVTTPESEGWGECVAMAAPTYTAEYVDGAHQLIRTHLVPRLLAGESLDAIKGNPMAKAAVEMALLDAELRAADTSFADHLGGVRTHVDAGVAVGITDDLAALLDVVDAYVAEGYRRVKLKIQPGWDVEPVEAVRSRHPDLLLQVDANGAYARTPADADHLARLDAFDLALIEQPLADDDLLGHAELARRLRTPICLDESITSAHAAAAAIALGACGVVNIKAGRVGGYAEARRVHDICRANDVPVWCGGMLETGLGRAANVALASLPGFTLPGDLSASDRYYDPDLTEPFTLHDGRLEVPAGPGLGVTPIPEILAAVTTSVERFTPPA